MNLSFKTLWPIVLTLIGAVAPFLSTPVQNFYAAHAQGVAAFAGVWAAIKWLLPSPLQSPSK